MEAYEKKLEAACLAHDMPGVVLFAADTTGKFQYQKAFGKHSLKDPNSEPIALDATFILASCTKVVTAIAALHCVDRGQIGLDDDVSVILTELKDVQIITSVDEETGKPVFRQPVNKITLRHLLTNSSGMAYDSLNPLLAAWRASRGEAPGINGMSLIDRSSVPLVAEPGTAYHYGPSSDWAGVLVARLNGMSLQDSMQKYLWDPLGIKDMTFHLEQNENVRERMPPLNQRGDDVNPISGEYGDNKCKTSGFKIYDDPIVDEYGGAGLMGSGPDFMKLLQSILRNDGKILKPETVDEIFRPQMSPEAAESFQEFVDSDFNQGIFGSQVRGTKSNYALGAPMVLQDTACGRRSGSIGWNGMALCLWWIDRESGLCGFYGSQLLPFADHKSHLFEQEWERCLYDELEKFKSSSK